MTQVADSQTTTTISELVAAARNQIQNLTVEEFRAAVADGAVVVDIREPNELETTGTIPGAIAAPRGMLEFWGDPTSPYHKAEFQPGGKTLLYCASGGRSALAASALKQLGYSDIGHLDGGVTAWTEAGEALVAAD